MNIEAQKYANLTEDPNAYDARYYNLQNCKIYDAFVDGSKSESARLFWFESTIILFESHYDEYLDYKLHCIMTSDDMPLSFINWFHTIKNV